jgi:hypothetical protein
MFLGEVTASWLELELIGLNPHLLLVESPCVLLKFA